MVTIWCKLHHNILLTIKAGKMSEVEVRKQVLSAFKFAGFTIRS